MSKEKDTVKRSLETTPGKANEKAKKLRGGGDIRSYFQDGISDPDSDSENGDIMEGAEPLQDIQEDNFTCTDFSDIGVCFQQLSRKLDSIRFEVANLKDRVRKTEKTTKDLSSDIKTVRKQLKSTNNAMVAYDLWSRKWNTRIHGLPGDHSKEKGKETENVVREFFHKTLKLEPQIAESMQFQAAHRLPPGKNAKQPKPGTPLKDPIMIRFLNLNDRDIIFAACKKHLKPEMGISVIQDLPPILVQLKKELLATKGEYPKEEQKSLKLRFFKQAPFIDLYNTSEKVVVA